MSQALYPIDPQFSKHASMNQTQYRQQYDESLRYNEQYWGAQAACIEWMQPFHRVKQASFYRNDFGIAWYVGGKTNVSYNCVDRHAQITPNKVAIIWEGDDPSKCQSITYLQLLERVCRFANVLKRHGVVVGDRVAIYMPMMIDAAVVMLACTRIGAVHTVIFGGFSPESIAGRIADSGCKIVVTADEGLRGGKIIPLKANIDQALVLLAEHSVRAVLVVKRTRANITWQEGRDYWYDVEQVEVSSECEAMAMDAEAPLFILYTSGSTGKPKGVLHTTAGYLVYVTTTFKHVFDYQFDDVFWCTADVGWITGHSYLLYGALSNGATTVMFEGVPQHPTWARVGEVVDKHQVTILYTAPTAIRAMMREGDGWVKQSSRSSLRLLGSVGEPINPEAWEWYYRVIGDSRCPIVDTWWQTETGGILIAPIPGASALKPGSATFPLFGIQPAILDQEGNILHGECEGNLVLIDSWPGQMRTVYGDHQRFFDTYFSMYEGFYFTGDGARRDADGYYWITGRVDDVLNVSGHRLGTAEIESALVAHEAVAESAAVGMPHDIKGQGICAFVTLQIEYAPNDALKRELTAWVRTQIGPIATPDKIYWAPALPKTRSGKIMRRILRKLAAGEFEGLGDLSTLADPVVVAQLIEEVKSS